MRQDPVWGTPPTDLALANDEVHVWRAQLDLTQNTIQSLRRTLAADELARAERFRFAQDRERFIAARGVLRAILGRYLEVEPGRVLFSYSAQGEPALDAEGGRSDGGLPLEFNLSHAGGLALYAFARTRRVGVDLEHVRSDVACSQLAKRFFSPREQAQLSALPPHLQDQAFFTCWTRKEAYLKARGDGLTLPLDQFDVSLSPGEPAMLLHTAFDPFEAARWSLQDLQPAPGYVAALAVEGHGWRLACWQWPKEWLRD
jgi:4'-phosphopantetheinyl transferase